MRIEYLPEHKDIKSYMELKKTRMERNNTNRFKVSFYKNKGESNHGIELKVQRDGTLIVSNVKSYSLSAYAGLEEGCEILQINSINCAGMKKDQIYAIIYELEDNITLSLKKIKYVTVDFCKSSKNATLGALFSKNCRGSTIIARTKPGTPMANSKLKVGYEIVSINNITCNGLGPRQVAGLLNELQGDVRIIAKCDDRDTEPLEQGPTPFHCRPELAINNLDSTLLGASRQLDTETFSKKRDSVDMDMSSFRNGFPSLLNNIKGTFQCENNDGFSLSDESTDTISSSSFEDHYRRSESFDDAK